MKSITFIFDSWFSNSGNHEIYLLISMIKLPFTKLIWVIFLFTEIVMATRAEKRLSPKSHPLSNVRIHNLSKTTDDVLLSALEKNYFLLNISQQRFLSRKISSSSPPPPSASTLAIQWEKGAYLRMANFSWMDPYYFTIVLYLFASRFDGEDDPPTASHIPLTSASFPIVECVCSENTLLPNGGAYEGRKTRMIAGKLFVGIHNNVVGTCLFRTTETKRLARWKVFHEHIWFVVFQEELSLQHETMWNWVTTSLASCMHKRMRFMTRDSIFLL